MLIEAFAEREAELERRAIKRAGLIAASIYNNNPYRRGSKTWKADDFLADRTGPPLGSPEWLEGMRAFARRHNARVQ